MRPYEPLLNIVPEGWGVIAALGGGAVLLAATAAASTAATLVALTMLVAARFYGDWRHGGACKPRGVLSPVDGRVIHRREGHDPVLGREAIRIVIAVSWSGGYCLRAPIAGAVSAPPGAFCPRTSRIRTEEGEDIIVRAPSSGRFGGWLGRLTGARPMMLNVGQRVGQGRRCGLRRMAREIEVLVPAGARIEVEPGQRVRSGETLLATLLRKS